MTHPPPSWRFFRAGGFDQVRIETSAELMGIGALDQKLWVALACPVKGTEFDPATLALLDADGDGSVRAADLIAAVEWAGQRLSDPDALVKGLAGVPLAAIRDDDEEGARIARAAQEVLRDCGGDLITVAMAQKAQESFAQRAQAQWEAAEPTHQALGEGMSDAYKAFDAVRSKVEDWFARCELAAFDERAAEAMNASADALGVLAGGVLSSDSEGISALPLARVGSEGQLVLDAGINPAWASRMSAFREAVALPLLGAVAVLDRSRWQTIVQLLEPYAQWLAARPDPAALGEGTRELERLARFVRDLLAFANNFVAFRDFYARKGPGSFQVGTLYLDGRSCELCVAVNDAARHAALASLSRICLVYVDCVRATERMSVAAAFTSGDADQLMVGRNGIFYDRKGQDWHATVTRIVDHPISLRQAFWSPYKRVARLVGAQLQKLAAARSDASDAHMGQLVDGLARKAATPAPAPAPASAAPPAAVRPEAARGAAPAPAPAQPPFDVGKFAGIFAAIGLAVGALGTAFASVLTGVLSLRWWQIPIALAGVVLAISGPSMALAWLKLRSRNLGPILDANGWAINARARINIPFGTALTQLASLPPQAQRSLTDPFAEKSSPWGWYALALLALLVCVALWYFGLLPFQHP